MKYRVQLPQSEPAPGPELVVTAEVGERRTRQEMLLSLLMIALQRRDAAEARSLIREGLSTHLELLVEEEARVYTTVWLILAARSMVLLRRPIVAVTLWGAIEGILIEEHEGLEDTACLRRELNRVRAERGPEAYETAVAAGKAMSLLQAAHRALHELDSTPIA